MSNEIGKRINECLGKLDTANRENAFIQLSLAIEGTGKLVYPHMNSSAKRNKQFIKDSLPFVLWFLTNGTLGDSKHFSFLTNNNGIEKEILFEDVMYK